MLSRLTIDQRREQLVDCALRIAEDSGLAAVTVRGVADAAGVSLGIVHYCFAGKDELMAAVVGTAMTRHLDAFVSGNPLIAGTSDGTAARAGREALHAAVSGTVVSVLALTRESPGRWMVLVESVVESLRSPAGSAARANTRHQHELAELYGARFLATVGERTGMHWQGRERDVVRCAVQTIYGVFQWWLVDRDDEAAARSCELLVDWAVALAVPGDPVAPDGRTVAAGDIRSP
ncbi:TetR/AcrR family transcriptional regulator [Williamsia deligens]|uniref:TetR/AcrR family transcriptional regulator n=1 Tax=Williamsia deligens TaxID=321325 RepID=A0ABW3GAN4_9NOCA|nr:TetR/AcrR family transcriptional regulator [Williamsia deligens]MCP2196248.1 transcriptional regulator, TetR family [Williamsia deligens]